MTNYSFVLRFLFVGGSTAFIFLGSTFGLVEGLGISAVLASTFACVIALCFNYLLHYLLMCTGGLLLNGLIMYFGTTLEAVHYMVVQIFAGLAMLCWSLCLSYFWVFRSSR
jgi:putative flippase GtrA